MDTENDTSSKSTIPDESTDASLWAKSFIEHKNRNNWSLEDIDESLMIGWFANAMMAMRDSIQSAPEMEQIIRELREMLDIQGSNGNWNYNPAMHGMYNGMEFAIATMEGREPEFREAPDKWLIHSPPQEPVEEPVEEPENGLLGLPKSGKKVIDDNPLRFG